MSTPMPLFEPQDSPARMPPAMRLPAARRAAAIRRAELALVEAYLAHLRVGATRPGFDPGRRREPNLGEDR